MLAFLFFICMILVFGRMIGLAIRMAWGITKVLFTIVFLPLILIGLLLGGLLYIAFPLLIIIALVSILFSAMRVI